MNFVVGFQKHQPGIDSVNYSQLAVIKQDVEGLRPILKAKGLSLFFMTPTTTITITTAN